MAFSPFEKSYNSLNRSRSSSCSSPKTNRIFYQEVYSNGNDTLIRSFSCDQFVNRSDDGHTFQAIKYQVSNFITPRKLVKKEADQTWSLPKTLAIDYPSPKLKSKARLSLHYPDDKQKLTETNGVPSQEKSDSNNARIKLKMNFLIASLKYILVPLLVLYVANVIWHQRQCHQSWDEAELSNKLVKSVFGQDQAISSLLSLMNYFNKNENSFALMFTGDVGVGKTYTASIINQNLPWASSNVLSFTNPVNYMGENNIKEKLSTCGANLVIIDDISLLDSTRAIMFTKKILDGVIENQRVLVILIFRIQNKEQENLVLSQLQTSNISFYHIPFRNLNKDDIFQCFNTEIKRLQVEVPEKKLVKLVEEQMVYIDILRGPPGCKGVSDQISKFYLKP